MTSSPVELVYRRATVVILVPTVVLSVLQCTVWWMNAADWYWDWYVPMWTSDGVFTKTFLSIIFANSLHKMKVLDGYSVLAACVCTLALLHYM